MTTEHEATTNSLVGHYALTLEPCDTCDRPRSKRQGSIIDNPEPGYYLVEWYSWFTGGVTHRQLVPAAAVTDWHLTTNLEWHDAYVESTHHRHRRCDQTPTQPPLRPYEPDPTSTPNEATA